MESLIGAYQELKEKLDSVFHTKEELEHFTDEELCRMILEFAEDKMYDYCFFGKDFVLDVYRLVLNGVIITKNQRRGLINIINKFDIIYHIKSCKDLSKIVA